MIKFSAPDGTAIYVRKDHVTSVVPAAAGSYALGARSVLFLGGQFFAVTESVSAVLKALA